MRVILAITVGLLIAVLSLAYLYFSNISQGERSNDKILTEIPGDASLILRFQNEQEMYEIFKDFTLFDAINGKEASSQISWLKTTLISNAGLYELTVEENVFVSVHPTKGDSVAMLWLMPIRSKTSVEELIKLFEGSDSLSISTPSGGQDRILKLSAPALKGSFYLSLNQNILRGSFSKDLLEKSIDPGTTRLDKNFINKINISLKSDANALVNLFINQDRKAGFLKPYFKDSPSGNLALFNSLNATTALRMNFKSDALMFNGITTPEGNSDNYIKLFLNQQPAENTIKRIYPLGTANAIAYGLSDPAKFQQDLKKLLSKRKELDGLEKQLELIRTETGVFPDRDIRKLLLNEFTTIQLASWESLAIVKLSNGTQMDFYLDPLSSVYSPTVKRMNYPELFYYYLGDPFKKYSKPYFAITDNLLILSNSPSTVQKFLNDYNSNRLLRSSESYTQFDQLIADQSNISFTMQLGNSRSLLRNILRRSYSKTLSSDDYGIKDIYGLSFQLVSNGEYFFTNFYAGYKPGIVNTDSLVYLR